jgi:hypothetical protein
LAESQLLAFEIPAGRIDANRRQQWIANGLRAIEHRETNKKNERHRGEQAASLARIADPYGQR